MIGAAHGPAGPDVLIAASGVGGTIFASNLSSWNQTIADRQREIEALRVTDRSQRNDLEDRGTRLSQARTRENTEKATDGEATPCRACRPSCSRPPRTRPRSPRR